MFQTWLDQDIFGHIDALERNAKSAEKSRNDIRDRLIQLSDMLAKQKYFLSDELFLVDFADRTIAVVPQPIRHPPARYHRALMKHVQRLGIRSLLLMS